MARAIVLHKSRNWDSPADVIRAEHRLTQLSNRERRKRKYNKQNEEFWNSGKKELMSKTKRQCVSSQQLQETESTPLNSNDSCSEITSTVNSENSSGNSQTKQLKLRNLYTYSFCICGRLARASLFVCYSQVLPVKKNIYSCYI